MRRLVLVLGLTVAAGCATRQPSHPFIPRRAMVSGTSVLAAQGGVMATAVGAQLMTSRHNPRTRKAGAAMVAGGGALLGAAVAEAIRAKKEQEMLLEFDAAWRRDMSGSPSVDSPLPPPLPPPPVDPWEFKSDSPLGGTGP